MFERMRDAVSTAGRKCVALNPAFEFSSASMIAFWARAMPSSSCASCCVVMSAMVLSGKIYAAEKLRRSFASISAPRRACAACRRYRNTYAAPAFRSGRNGALMRLSALHTILCDDAFHDLPPLPVPQLRGVTPEAALGKLVPASGDEAQDQVGARGRVGVRQDLVLRDAEAHRLLERRFEPVVQLVDARLQLLVFVHERVADQHARHAFVLLREAEQHADDGFDLARAAFLLARDLVDEGEKGLLDEFDQPFVHLRL